jgi:ParB family chromosome partitioning protein
MVREGRLNMGHARALLGLESDHSIERLARQAASRGLSVRQVESLVKRERQGESRPTTPQVSPAARDLVHRLEQALATRVKLVQQSPKSGRLEIHYTTLDQLDAILARIIR